MVQEVRIPFSNLNDIQFVQGFEDVVFEVPQVSDIEDAVIDAIFPPRSGLQTMDDVIAEIVGAVEQNTSIEIPGEGSVIQNPLREIYQNTAGGIDLADEAIEDIVAAIEGATGVDVPGDGSVIDGVADVTLGREAVEDIIREGVMDVFDDVTPDTVNVRIDGIFGPLSEDVAQALSDILNFDPGTVSDDIVSSVEQELGIDVPGDGPILEDIPTVDAIGGEVESKLQGVCPELNGVNLCEDASGFVQEVWNEISPKIADPEVIEELEQALEDAPELQREEP